MAAMTAPIPALSVRPPYGTFIIIGQKLIETRSWAPHRDLLGRRIAIHQSKTFESDELFFMLERISPVSEVERFGLDDPQRYPKGFVLGTARLANAGRVVSATGRGTVMVDRLVDGKAEARVDAFGNFVVGRWLWFFEDVERWEAPVEARGRLGIWTFSG